MASQATCFEQQPYGKLGNLLWPGALWKAWQSALSRSPMTSHAICLEQQLYWQAKLSCNNQQHLTSIAAWEVKISPASQAIFYELQLFDSLAVWAIAIFDKHSHLFRMTVMWQVKTPVLSRRLMAILAICFEQIPNDNPGNLLWAGALWEAWQSAMSRSLMASLAICFEQEPYGKPSILLWAVLTWQQLSSLG